jgi:CO/xanthine dehydrogenase Mo-binding subunit
VSRLDDLIGRSIPKLDARAKVSGGAIYTDDLHRPRMLHTALLGSAYPHARIRAIDTRAARALPGVKAVLTADDLPPRNIGHTVRDEPILARDTVRYVGEPVAAVAAETLAIARAALLLIEVDYAPLPAVLDIDAALAPDAPLLHPQVADYVRLVESPFDGNVISHIELETGDLARGWAECDVILENEYEIPAINHLYLETCAALAEVDGSGKITVWCSTQQVFGTQAAIACALDLPMSKVRCIAPAVGGAFGGKFITIEPITAALALAARRPVKLVLPRDDDMSMMRSRHAARIRVKTGARRDGTLWCRDTEIVLNGGAYADMSPVVLEASVLLAHGPYRIPHVRNVGRAVYTNRLRAGAMRGFGVMQTAFAGESQLDELAARLGLDPIELRVRNAQRSGDYNMGSHHLPVCHIGDCVARIAEHPAFVAARAERHGPSGKRRGIGVASIAQQSGLFASSAAVRIAEDGSVMVSAGYIDIGTGSDTTLAQICAATLGLDIEQVNIVAPDTDGIAYDYGTAADRGAHGVAESVHRAALAVKARLCTLAAEMLECASEDLELRPGGRVGVRGAPAIELPFSAIAQRGMYAGGGPIIGTHAWYMQEQRIDPARTRSLGFRMGGGVYYGFAATAVQVEVDEDTGQVEVLQAWHAHDVGRVLSPVGTHAQIYGGVAQGISGALLEELVWDDGRLANPSLMDYKIAGALDVPTIIHPILLENPDPDSPWGARGMAEPCVIGAAPAIANAIADAVGARVRRLPLTPERVLAALPVAAPDA